MNIGTGGVQLASALLLPLLLHVPRVGDAVVAVLRVWGAHALAELPPEVTRLQLLGLARPKGLPHVTRLACSCIVVWLLQWGN